ncbi:MAG: hypothetical protein ACRENC_12670, partial [Gemmatimonadaceae bacterium]
MLATLIESRRLPRRGTGGPAASVAIHAVLIMLLVAVTAHAGEHPSSKQAPPDIYYSVPATHHPPAPPPRTVSRPATAPPRPSTPLLPRFILNTIQGEPPTIDISSLLATGHDFSPGPPDSPGMAGGELPGNDGSESPYTAAQVEQPALALPG